MASNSFNSRNRRCNGYDCENIIESLLPKLMHVICPSIDQWHLTFS